MALSVFDIITESVSDTWQHRHDLRAYAFLPVFAAAIAGTLIFTAIGDPEFVTSPPEAVSDAPAPAPDDSRVIIDGPDTTTLDQPQVTPAYQVRWLFGNLVNWIISMTLYTTFAVAWHRRFLGGSGAPTLGAALRWDRRHWQFFRNLSMLIVNLTMLLVVSSLLLRAALPFFLAMSGMLIVVCLLFARASLILPAAAVGAPMTIAESARLTVGSGWRILAAVILPQLITMLLTGVAVLFILMPETGIFDSSVAALFLLAFAAESVKYVGFAVGITALSLTYRQLTT